MNKGDRWQRQLGICIRRARVRNGWTQHELVVRLRQCGFRRCSRAMLSQVETGIAIIRGYEIYYLRQVFGKAFEQEFWRPFDSRKEAAK